MRDKIKNILLLIGFITIVWMFWNPAVVTEVKTVTVTVPAKKGTTGEVKFEEVERDTVTLRDTVYLHPKEIVVVDKKYKKLYEEAKDSLERQALYLEAIRIKEYNKVFVDNDTITINGSITTRGSLVGYKFNYFVKESQITYIPKVHYRYPRFGLGLGIEVGVPTTISNKLTLKSNFIITRRNNNFSISYDTNGVIWGGFTKTLKIY